MAAIHELYGIVSEQLEMLRIEYGKLLFLLSRVKSKEVDPDDITIIDNGWTLNQKNAVQDGQSPKE